MVASVPILIGPLLFGISFFVETYTPELTRPIGKWAIVVTAAGVAGHALATLLDRFYPGQVQLSGQSRSSEESRQGTMLPEIDELDRKVEQ